ncbi:hypothetical protein LZ575_04035 [Antarcticibacterium sp. 1MA-6-2]|uniref:hypothetical protein n=1 Tax=Antarcticibacterium sp. 1MA-6-2 TaxID=2908210 RepID=UPI001F2FD756|nr:hypothetical protein [Antarcticibacterium sp. 1MA-6-2]UJH91838.1 hypothetical protein LZ575_04035 [Antarcticibacterium sp. 1MA-6-2]
MFTIFIYVNDKKILDAQSRKLENLEERLIEAEESNKTLKGENLNLQYFSLSNNEEAISYFEERGIDAIELAQLVENEIISRNQADRDNELVPFAGMEGKMRINKIKILNHKWIIADFTDGTYWGELFITYDIDENSNLVLNTEKSFLYPSSN